MIKNSLKFLSAYFISFYQPISWHGAVAKKAGIVRYRNRVDALKADKTFYQDDKILIKLSSAASVGDH